MKRGHVTGDKKERRQRETPWHAAIDAENLARVEREWAERQAQEPIEVLSFEGGGSLGNPRAWRQGR